ncbi:MAG: hypothetical protein ACI4JB_09065 [Porcipelethomonas sp.]
MPIRPMNRFQKIRYYAVVRWTIYIFLIFVSAILINVGRGVKPIYFIPLCICICMNEGEYTSAVLGGVCGLIIDEAYGRTFFGFSSVFLIAFSVGSTIIFRHFLFKNGINVVIMTAVCTFIYQILDYFFYYAMWDYEGAGYVFSDISVPCILYTILVSPVIYLIVKQVVRRFYPKKAKTIEEAMKV